MAKKSGTLKKRRPGSTQSGVRQKTQAIPKQKAAALSSSKFDPTLFSSILMGLILLFIVVSRAQFFEIPMERDEGIYSYFGKLILGGSTPYLDFYEIRLPGIFYMYAFLVAIFGYSIKGLAIGILLLNMATAVMLYLIGKRLFASSVGIIAAASFAMLSLSPEISGFSRQSEHIVVFWVTASLLMMLKAFDTEKPWHFVLAGVLACAGFLTKANAVFYILMMGLLLVVWYFFKENRDWKKLFLHGLYYSGGVFGLFAFMCLAMAGQGVLSEMWYWAFEASAKYVSMVSWEEGRASFNHMFGEVMANHSLLWIPPIAGAVLIFCTKLSWVQKITAPLLLIFSFLTITPGLRFYNHYWLMVIPGLALLMGILFYSLQQLLAVYAGKRIAALVPFVFLLLVFWQLKTMGSYYFAPDYHKILRDTYAENPFPEAKVIGDYIKARINPGDPIALIGSEPQLFVYTQGVSPTRHAYFSYLMRDTTYTDARIWQEEYKRDVEAAKPKYVVYFEHPISLLTNPHSDRSFFNWANDWVNANYHKVGLADILAADYTKYSWGAEAANYQSESKLKVHIFERR